MSLDSLGSKSSASSIFIYICMYVCMYVYIYLSLSVSLCSYSQTLSRNPDDLGTHALSLSHSSQKRFQFSKLGLPTFNVRRLPLQVKSNGAHHAQQNKASKWKLISVQLARCLKCLSHPAPLEPGRCITGLSVQNAQFWAVVKTVKSSASSIFICISTSISIYIYIIYIVICSQP